MTFRLILIAALVGLSLTVPLPRGLDSNEECPVSEDMKMKYMPGKTYIYSYKGKSEVRLHGGNSKAQSSIDWQAEVSLSWLSPCQVSVVLKKHVVNGHSEDHILTEILTEKPMIAVIKDGVVVKVLADPKDHPTGLNMKKGVIASIQNVLPKVTTLVANKTFVESDTLGHCPTMYSVEDSSANYLIYKKKNHKECKHQQKDSSSNLFTSVLLKFPVTPLSESRSECTQVIRKSDKIITSVSCVDRNVISSLVSSHMTAVQESRLSLERIVDGANPPRMETTRPTDLKFEAVPQPKTETIMPKVQELFKKLCVETEQQLKEEAASVMAKIIGYLHRVPENKFKVLLSEIRRGSLCPNSKRLESLFLDAIAFVDSGGAVEIMVQEAVSQGVTCGRTLLYTLGLHLMRKPCIYSMDALKPLFESAHTPSSMRLAAGSLVHRYCEQHPHCMKESPVREIQQKLASKINSYCTLSVGNQEKKREVLSALKTVGNMADVTETLKKSVLSCLESQEADVYVRVAAAQAYRRVPCRNQPTRELVNQVLKTSQNPEVRISSYVACVRCVSYEQAEKIVREISEEHNTQVRSYILSHLRNLQRSDAPHQAGLRYNLTSLYVPADYEQDVRKYSRNIDLSYYFPSLGLGAGIDTSVIYTPGYYLPRQLQTNITANIYDEVINVGEFAIRVKDLDYMINAAFGPEGYFQDLEIPEMIEKVMKFLKTKGSLVREQFEELYNRPGKDMDWSSVNELLKMFTNRRTGSQPIDIDAFVRIFGSEIKYVSASLHPKSIDIEKTLENLMKSVINIYSEATLLKINSARTLQSNWEYYIPTVQGIPLQLKFVLTLISSFEAQNNIEAGTITTDAQPCLSLDVNAFAGYSVGVKAGLRSKTKLSLKPHSKVIGVLKNSKVEIVYDIPAKVKLLKLQVNNYMMIKMPSKEDQRLPPTYSQSLITKKICSDYVRSVLGVSACTEVKYPSFAEKPIVPLGELVIDTEIEKISPSKELIKFTGHIYMNSPRKSVSVQLETPGASNTKKGEIGLEYKGTGELQSFKLFGKGPSNQERAIQVDLKGRRSSQRISSQVIIYYGRQLQLSSSDEVFVTSVKGGLRENEIEGEFILRTKSYLAHYIKADVEVDASLHLSRYSRYLPRSLELKKWEVSVEIPELFKTVNYIRKTSASSSMEYDVYSMLKTRYFQLWRLQGKSQQSGEFRRSNYEALVRLSGKVLSLDIDAESKAVYNRNLKQFRYYIRSPSTQHYYILMNLEAKKESSSKYETKAEVKIPSLIRSYYVTGSVQQQAPRQYQVNLEAKRESETLLEVKGPVNVQIKSGLLRTKSEVAISVPSTSQEYMVKTITHLSREKNEAMIQVKKGSRTVFSVEGEFEREGESLMNSLLGVTIPKVIDAQLKSEKSSSSVQLVLNAFVKPNTPESRKVKAMASFDLRQKEIKAKVAYDVDRNPQKKVEVIARYDYNYERKYVSVRGDVNMQGKEYQYNSEAVLGLLTSQPNRKNELMVKITNPEGKEMRLESDYQVSRESNSKLVSYKTILKPFHGQPNEITSRFTYNIRHIPYQIELKGEAKVRAPFFNVRETKMDVDTQVDLRRGEQKAHYKMDVTGPTMQSPIKVYVELENNERKIYGKTDVNLGPSEIRVNGQAEITKNEERLIGDVSMELDVKVSQNKNYKLKATKNSQIVDFVFLVDGRKIIAIEHANNRNGVWYAKVTTPTQVTEGRSQYTSNSVSFEVYPNRLENDRRYGASGHFQHSNTNSGREMSAGARIQYPGSQKDYGVSTNFVQGEKITRGTVELDIFRTANEKVVLDINVLRKARYSYKLEADVKIPSQNFKPRIEADIALSPEVKSMELYARKSPSQKPIIALVVRSNRATPKNYILYAKLKTPSDHVEIISNLHLHELRSCRGGSMNGTIESRSLGKYDFASSVCAPAYVEFGVKKSHERQMYLAKVGIRNHDSIKVALDLVQNSMDWTCITCMLTTESTLSLYGRPEYRRKIPIVRLGAKMWPSSLLTLESHYNVTGIEEYANRFIYPAGHRIRSIVAEVTDHIPEELRGQLVPRLPELSSELKQDLKIIQDTVSEIYEAYAKKVSRMIEQTEEIKEQIESHCYTLRRYAREMVAKLEEYIEETFGFNSSDVRGYIEEIDSKYLRSERCQCTGRNCLTERIQCTYRELKKIPVVRETIRYIESSSFWEWIVKNFEHMKEKVREEFHYYYHAIKQEIHKIYHKIMENPTIRRFVKWVESFIHDLFPFHSYQHILGQAVGKITGVYLTERVGWVRLSIPMYSPIYSVHSVVPSSLMKIPPSRIMHHIREPSSVMEYIIHPYAANARIEGEQMTTFDGLVIPLIPSKCELLIAEVHEDRIIVKKPSESQTDVRVQLESGKQIKIILEEDKAPKVPMLQGSNHLRIPGANITKISEEVIVQMKGLKLRVHGNSVEVMAKPWAFSQLEGLMGNHDSEMSNDIHQGAEVKYNPQSYGHKHHVAQSSARQIMEKYRVNRSCTIPRV